MQMARPPVYVLGDEVVGMLVSAQQGDKQVIKHSKHHF